MSDSRSVSHHSSRASGLDRFDESCEKTTPEIQQNNLEAVESRSHISMADSLDDIALEKQRLETKVDISGMETLPMGEVKEARKERAKFLGSKSHSGTNYENRDPKHVQDYIKVDFSDVIAEPEGSHSFNTVWGTSYKVFSVTKFWVYRVMTLLLGIPAALLWGVYFAFLAFLSIWCISPAVKSVGILLRSVGGIWSVVVRTFLDPLFSSIGLILSGVRLTVIRAD